MKLLLFIPITLTTKPDCLLGEGSTVDRREFVQLVPLTALGAGLAAQNANAQDASAQAGKVAKQAAGYKKQKLPAYAGKLGISDHHSGRACGLSTA